MMSKWIVSTHGIFYNTAHIESISEEYAESCLDRRFVAQIGNFKHTLIIDEMLQTREKIRSFLNSENAIVLDFRGQGKTR